MALLLLALITAIVSECYAIEETKNVKELLGKLVEDPVAKELIIKALHDSESAKRRQTFGWKAGDTSLNKRQKYGWWGGDALSKSEVNNRNIDEHANELEKLHEKKSNPPSLPWARNDEYAGEIMKKSNVPALPWKRFEDVKSRLQRKKELYKRIIGDVNELFKMDK